MKTFEPPLDPEIEDIVKILREHGVETYESCQGGPGHSYPRPAVRFHSVRFLKLGSFMKNQSYRASEIWLVSLGYDIWRRRPK